MLKDVYSIGGFKADQTNGICESCTYTCHLLIVSVVSCCSCGGPHVRSPRSDLRDAQSPTHRREVPGSRPGEPTGSPTGKPPPPASVRESRRPSCNRQTNRGPADMADFVRTGHQGVFIDNQWESDMCILLIRASEFCRISRRSLTQCSMSDSVLQ